MVRFLLLSILLTIVLRAASVLWTNIVRGVQGQPGTVRGGGRSVPQQGVQMVRDPVCGTFIVRDHAVTFSASGGTRLYFCSQECRDKYLAQSAQRPAAHGRPA